MSNDIRISQHTAILLEHARNVLNDEARIKEAIRLNDVKLLQDAEEEHYQYDDFLTYTKAHNEQIEQALEGYQMTFNTRNGLKIWVEKKFNLQANDDFKFGENRIDELQLDQQQLAQLRQALAVNWIIIDNSHHDGIHEVSLVLRVNE